MLVIMLQKVIFVPVRPPLAQMAYVPMDLLLSPTNPLKDLIIDVFGSALQYFFHQGFIQHSL
jgi:hypothetical protein